LLLADKPFAKIATHISTAEPGDYVVSDNGWVVPLVAVTWLEDKNYNYNGDRRPRRKIFKYKVYHFPKQKKAFRAESLHRAVFNYMPGSSNNFASDGKRNRAYELSVRKIQFAQYIIKGYDPMSAARLVYPKVNNLNKLIKSLLTNDKLMNFIAEKQGLSVQEQLVRSGITYDLLANQIKAIFDLPFQPRYLSVKAKLIKSLQDLFIKAESKTD